MTQYIEKWKLANDAFVGLGGFNDGSYLTQFGRETDDKYESRQNIAYYDNLFQKGINRYVGYLFKDLPSHSTSNELVKIILNDCDKKGNSISDFMADFSIKAKVRGTMVCLVDMVKELPKTREEQIKQRAVPFLQEIEPEKIKSYILDSNNNFLSVTFETRMNIIENGETKNVSVFKTFTDKDWKITRGDETIDSGKLSIGVCPIVYFSEDGSFPALGEFTQIGDLSKRLYNLNSEMDELLRSQTFSILTINMDNPKDVSISLGTDNAISYGKDLKAPAYISPESSPTDAYNKKISKIEERIKDITYDVVTSTTKESGIALEIKFQGLNASLNKFATKLQRFEMKIFDIASKYLQIENSIEISYPTNFNIIDVEHEVDVLASIKDLGYVLPSYEAAKLKKIINTDLGNIDEDTISKIETEIQDMTKEV